MTLEDAKQWIENNFYGDLSIEEQKENLNCLIDRIYKEQDKYEDKMDNFLDYVTEGKLSKSKAIPLEVMKDSYMITLENLIRINKC